MYVKIVNWSHNKLDLLSIDPLVFRWSIFIDCVRQVSSSCMAPPVDNNVLELAIFSENRPTQFRFPVPMLLQKLKRKPLRLVILMAKFTTPNQLSDVRQNKEL